MKYEYVTDLEEISQYDDLNLEENKIVNARYIHALIDADKGNPYIEALPLPRSENNITRVYTKTLPSYKYDDVKKMEPLQKMLAVGTLRELRFPLPFHSELEFNFYNSLVTSYRSRKRIESIDTKLNYVSYNKSKETHSILAGDSAAATNAGFSLIGYSGCGKSSSIQTLVSHYPQVIIHGDNTTSRFPQIVYLVVNCVANSNFSALYEGIGEAIDKALGNIVPIYSKEVAKINNLGRKAEKIKEYIERFAIGIIIFDEIQLIDFKHTKENSFDSLMTLSNRTKVAIAVVGTEDARNKMFKELRTSRRIGMMIKGHTYCESKKYFAFLLKNLLRYQWFDEPLQISDELVDVFYDLSKGIIDQLIGIYICVHFEYFRRKGKENVTPQFIKKVANKYYPNMQYVLNNLEDAEINEEYLNMKQNAELRIADILDKERQEQREKEILKNSDAEAELIIRLSNVVANIQLMCDFTDTQIENAFNKVISKKDSEEKSEREISRLTLEQLQKSTQKRKISKKEKTLNASQMRDFLEIDNKGE